MNEKDMPSNKAAEFLESLAQQIRENIGPFQKLVQTAMSAQGREFALDILNTSHKQIMRGLPLSIEGKIAEYLSQDLRPLDPEQMQALLAEEVNPSESEFDFANLRKYTTPISELGLSTRACNIWNRHLGLHSDESGDKTVADAVVCLSTKVERGDYCCEQTTYLGPTARNEMIEALDRHLVAKRSQVEYDPREDQDPLHEVLGNPSWTHHFHEWHGGSTRPTVSDAIICRNDTPNCAQERGESEASIVSLDMALSHHISEKRQQSAPTE